MHKLYEYLDIHYLSNDLDHRSMRTKPYRKSGLDGYFVLVCNIAHIDAVPAAMVARVKCGVIV
jgi:hypothetical protein